MHYEVHLAVGDDTALNGVTLECYNLDNEKILRINKEGHFSGATADSDVCSYNGKDSSSFITGARLRSEAPQTSDGDDTGSNSIEMKCGAGATIRTAFDGYYGDWSDWVSCPDGMAIDGMNVQIEPPVEGDDTAMNGIKFSCSPVAGRKSPLIF